MKDFKQIYNKEFAETVKEMKEVDLPNVINYLFSEISNLEKRITKLEKK